MTDPAPSPAADVPDLVLARASYRIGAVTLVARDVVSLTRFYSDIIGLRIVSWEADTVRLGEGGTVLLALRHDPAARHWRSTEAGLFHTAFLLPSRGELGAWLRYADAGGITLTGAADHLVSEALYLTDPEGNGIEIYVDRPSSEWQSTEDGSVLM
jgi:catechol 2,3-dioxygenase